MSTYLIGDVQGCFRSFKRLLKRLQYRSGRDTIWFLGDLVNRGPGSLDVLRWAMDENASAVLGNHDAYCLAVHGGAIPRRRDTLDAVFEAPDCDEIMNWLRHRPVMHRIKKSVLVHAGLDPSWTLKMAMKKARKIEARLQGDSWVKFLKRVFKEEGSTRQSVQDFNTLTRIRMVNAEGTPVFNFSGPPELASPDLRPWYVNSAFGESGVKVYFGHWAALDHRRLPMGISLDGGCVWGRRLYGHCLESDESISVPAHPKDVA